MAKARAAKKTAGKMKDLKPRKSAARSIKGGVDPAGLIENVKSKFRPSRPPNP